MFWYKLVMIAVVLLTIGVEALSDGYFSKLSKAERQKLKKLKKPRLSKRWLRKFLKDKDDVDEDDEVVGSPFCELSDPACGSTICLCGTGCEEDEDVGPVVLGVSGFETENLP